MSRRLVVVLLAVFAAVTVGTSTWGSRAEGATYEQVVDNSDEGRFAASRSWKYSDSGEAINGDDYRLAPPANESAHALFMVKIPADGEYAIYSRWHYLPGLIGSLSVGGHTSCGTRGRAY